MQHTVLSMQAKTQAYFFPMIIAGALAAVFTPLGIYILFLCISGKVYKPDLMSVAVVGIIVFVVGVNAFIVAIYNHKKHARSRHTYIEVMQENINGYINARRFEINFENVVSTSIQVCSVDCDYDGVPRNMSPSLDMKLHSETDKYLCIYTTIGKTYYIGGLTSPETAKNTIDSMIIQNMAARKAAEQ